MREVELGVIELHPQKKLREDFFKVVDSAQGFIVDVWLMDIASCLERHGYKLTVHKKEI